jgi:hypothetical protein
MGLEDEVRARQQGREAKAERFVARTEAARRELDDLISEFATAIAKRSDIAHIPVYECIRVDHGESLLHARFTFHPKNVLLGSGLLFTTYRDYGETSSRSPLVLMDDEETLIVPWLPHSLSRRTRGFGNVRIRGFWPKGEFVCWSHVFELPVNYDSGNEVAAVRAGMVEFLDRSS